MKFKVETFSFMEKNLLINMIFFQKVRHFIKKVNLKILLHILIQIIEKEFNIKEKDKYRHYNKNRGIKILAIMHF